MHADHTLLLHVRDTRLKLPRLPNANRSFSARLKTASSCKRIISGHSKILISAGGKLSVMAINVLVGVGAFELDLLLVVVSRLL
jgi:hypothetical protein